LKIRSMHRDTGVYKRIERNLPREPEGGVGVGVLRLK